MHRTIELPDDQARQLERLAAQERRSVDELVQLALGDFLARRTADRDYWLNRFREVVEHIQTHLPPDATPEEIEADISANYKEYLMERADDGKPRTNPADAGRH